MEMIAADTSSLVAFLQGDNGDDVELLTSTIRDEKLILPPPVLSEILSDPKLQARLADALIAQFCMDHNVALVTRDKDFRHFMAQFDLMVVPN